MTSNNQWTRVIVLTPPTPDGSQAIESLRPAFQARDWFAVGQSDPFQAMAELCLRERAQVARASWGLQRIEQIALVVAHQQYWESTQLNDLIGAVSRFLPAASVWEADDAELRPIQVEANVAAQAERRSLHHPAEPQANSVTSQPAGALPAPPPRLPLQSNLNDADGDELSSQSRLTRQEIDMLLANDPLFPSGLAS